MKMPVQVLSSLFHLHHEGKVKFIITGSAGDYNITIKSSEDHVDQLAHARKNWKRSFSAHEGDYVYFSAQANEPSAKVNVKIIFKGKVFRESSASGDYAIAYVGGCLC